ncbi:hypothetical protein DV736_g5206, partial [Chaetothyriales sp. CBS 134916]
MELDASATAQSHSLSDPYHRKIELQSPLDLTFLQANLSRCAQQKLDLHFPRAAAAAAINTKPAEFISLGGPGATNTDPLRTHVHTLLAAFLSRTWANALPSVSINGIDAPPSLLSDPSAPAQAHRSGQREETEGIDYMYTAFDGKLQQRVASLYAEVEALTAQVSRLRREAPARGAAGLYGGTSTSTPNASRPRAVEPVSPDAMPPG